MKKKSSGKFSSDWDQRLFKEKQLRRRLRMVMAGVLGAAVLAAIYLGVMIALQDEPTETADTPTPGAAIEGDGQGEGGADPGETEPAGGNPDEPTVAGGDDPADGTEGGGDSEAEPVSPLFGNNLVKKDLQAVEMGNERNLLLLIESYGEELADEAAREDLKKVQRLLVDGTAEQALEHLESLELPTRIKDSVRAVVLTRLLNKDEAGKAFAKAYRSSQPPEFNFEYGIYHLGAGDLPQAYNQFVAGIRKSPRSPHFQFAAAGAAFDLKRWKNVIEHVDTGSKRLTGVPSRIGLLAAFSEVRVGKIDDAVARCRKLLEKDSESQPVKLFLARILGAAGKLDDSLVVYNELLAGQPELATIKIEMVRAYLANDDKDNALKLAAEVAESGAEDVRIQAWYADVLAAGGKTEEAGAILEGISGDLRANELAVLKSIIALRENDHAAAAKALEPFHTMDPNLAVRWASFKFELGEAGIDVQEVLRGHHLNAIQWRGLANLAVSHELWNMAAFAYDRAIVAGDDSTGTLNNWAWTAMQNPKGFDVGKVVRACEQALETSPENPNVLHTLGQALLKSEQIGRCTELLVKHQPVTEASAELSLLQGQAYRALRAGPSSLEALERCLMLMEGAPAWNLEITREEVEKIIADLKG